MKKSGISPNNDMKLRKTGIRYGHTPWCMEVFLKIDLAFDSNKVQNIAQRITHWSFSLGELDELYINKEFVLCNSQIYRCKDTSSYIHRRDKYV